MADSSREKSQAQLITADERKAFVRGEKTHMPKNTQEERPSTEQSKEASPGGLGVFEIFEGASSLAQVGQFEER